MSVESRIAIGLAPFLAGWWTLTDSWSEQFKSKWRGEKISV